MAQQQWPIHQENEIVSILSEVETGSHRIIYREDGIVSIGLDPELIARAPGYVRKAALQPGVLIPRSDRDAIRRMFDKADALEAARPS